MREPEQTYPKKSCYIWCKLLLRGPCWSIELANNENTALATHYQNTNRKCIKKITSNLLDTSLKFWPSEWKQRSGGIGQCSDRAPTKRRCLMHNMIRRATHLWSQSTAHSKQGPSQRERSNRGRQRGSIILILNSWFGTSMHSIGSLSATIYLLWSQ